MSQFYLDMCRHHTLKIRSTSVDPVPFILFLLVSQIPIFAWLMRKLERQICFLCADLYLGPQMNIVLSGTCPYPANHSSSNLKRETRTFNPQMLQVLLRLKKKKPHSYPLLFDLYVLNVCLRPLPHTPPFTGEPRYVSLDRFVHRPPAVSRIRTSYTSKTPNLTKYICLISSRNISLHLK